MPRYSTVYERLCKVRHYSTTATTTEQRAVAYDVIYHELVCAYSTHWERLPVHRLSAELQCLLVGRGPICVCVSLVPAMCAFAHDDKKIVRLHHRSALIISPRCRWPITKEEMNVSVFSYPLSFRTSDVVHVSTLLHTAVSV